MKVRDIMTSSPLTCSPDSNLAEVAQMMWTADCGIVPITDDTGKLLGVVTDRDICIAASTQDKSPAAIHVNELPHGDVHSCRPEEETRNALRQMREYRVRRLPVAAADGTLRGMLSIRDVIVGAGNKAEISAGEILEAFEGICANQATPEVRPKPAAAPAARRS